MDDSRSQKRDTALIYLWLNVNKIINVADSDYMNFKPNGDYQTSNSLKDLKFGGIATWYTKDGSFTEIGCGTNGSAVISTSDYLINGDTLQITGKDKKTYKYKKVSKPIP